MLDMSNAPDYHEIKRLSNSELAKRTKAALDTFIQAVKYGGNVAEKAQFYNAYQDERLKRIKPINLLSDPLLENAHFRRGIILQR